ncbi:hypothetical protein GFB49_19435 [Epibacterium sp. SM1979]|uniref:Uncharacterized protein n=1 Tax=Tritonibacter litoralis TaxID=2662264 RepID=A0A843YN25_9RHOB|nr:hypothetical protein [Tritonibacter litoralis]MQQ10632.1 hypothetical protein [Tritonibacter litoralis]
MKRVFAISGCLIALTSVGGVVLSEVHNQFARPAMVKSVDIKMPQGPEMVAPAAETAFVAAEVGAFTPNVGGRSLITALSVPVASDAPIRAQNVIHAPRESTNVRVSLRPRARPAQTLHAIPQTVVVASISKERTSQNNLSSEPEKTKQLAALVLNHSSANGNHPVARKTPQTTLSQKDFVRVGILGPRSSPQSERKTQQTDGIRGLFASWGDGGAKYDIGTQHGVYR